MPDPTHHPPVHKIKKRKIVNKHELRIQHLNYVQRKSNLIEKTRETQDEIRKKKKRVIDSTRKLHAATESFRHKNIKSLEKENNKQKKNASFPVSPPVLPACLLVFAEVLCLQEKKRGKCNHSNKLTKGRGRKKKAESKTT